MGEHRHHLKRARGGAQSDLYLSTRDSSSPSPSETGEFGDSEQSDLRSLDRIGITELLENDSRPTFIIDLVASEKEINGLLKVTWSNKSLKFFDGLRRVINAETYYPSLTPPRTPSAALAAAEAAFKEWATSMPDFDNELDGYMPRYEFKNMYWTCCTLRKRWRVISASQVPSQRKKSHGTPRSSRSSSRSAPGSSRSFSTERSNTDTMTSEESELYKQLADSESKFKVMTELNPVGMYYLSPDGNILYCNDMWYEITGHPRGLEGEMSFMNVLSEIDHPMMAVEWEILTTTKARRNFELRLRKPWVDEITKEEKQRWILASCDQEFDEDGKLKTIMGCITDISRQKHAQEDALHKAALKEELARTTEEAAHHAKNFQQMAELAPCMFTFNNEGTITWANPLFYEMIGHPRNLEENSPMSFLNCVEQQDRQKFHEAWEKLTVAREEISMELRLKKPWIEDKEGAVRDAKWILFLALPQVSVDGTLTKVFGCTTDISGFKLAERIQMESRLKAEEAKKQQETFIDMTSHEMRNPLSAIMLCADGVANSVIDYQSTKDQTIDMLQDLLENNLDAAQTIVLCAQHQKRIIDDVLTLSKLNSTMLHVTPVQVQVESTVRRTLKMFESELQAHEISIDFTVESSYQQEGIDWVLCDPVRLTQIFINLLTNAIKFTRTESKREISVHLATSILTPPSEIATEIQWFPSKASNDIQDLTLAPDWGTGQQVYLYFAVTDTGRGLSEDEKTRLFHRFSQASPKTHVQYGGSGLGLFISRELTELQGGEIGVASREGIGSTFAFYIKARKATGVLVEAPIGISYSRLPTSSNTESNGTPRPTRLKSDYHILLVEDNLINQKVLSKQLRSTGSIVHVANHGVEALDFLSKTIKWKDTLPSSQSKKMDLSLILMDLEMPVMDGLACTRRIRDLEREGKIIGHVPIIAVTANTRLEQMETAIEAGMDDIVGKPFQIPELMQKMDQLMWKGH
ncbi:uncharacterized protein LY89DRAFT_733212 [Mollisia scopiformis]|uniref:Uncharacterized protein n=1 Tax=Mollisia scopiformis TaxID=149040 RepID=A0A194XB35_MOLSC|nr:uncharacterized protein LY89DRAFT_733212 [Mollisia scopiformis]KUJ17359.1 hypothetical protein LY89DRAFT_733212 [Mollisia scopiformis]